MHMPIIWNPYLVVLSILVAIFGSITALAHANRMRESTDLGAVVWMMTGGITLGLVIWAMHFIGMLAFHLSVPVSYDPQFTVLSVVLAVTAALLGFYLLRTKKMHFGRIAGGGLVIGLGISATHYTGMAALEMSPAIIYNPVFVSASVGIAVLAAYGALLIVYAGEKFQLPPLVCHGLGGGSHGVGHLRHALYGHGGHPFPIRQRLFGRLFPH
jgi:NO-binding membrane sensor protein with MHYT domain